MRVRGLVLMMLVGGPLMAQTNSLASSISPPPPPPPPSMIGGLVGGLPSVSPVKGQPYSLVEKTTRVQTLADGTTITHATEEHKMRDSEGRERTEIGDWKDGQFVARSVTLTDPMERTRTILLLRSKTVQVEDLSGPHEQSPEIQARVAELRAKREAEQKEHPDAVRAALPGIEKLPAQDIAGVMVEGIRMTRVIPAGKEGNDREMKSVTESWIAKDLKLNMRFVMDDPRVGKTTTEVTELQRMEPDPALFRVPEGYKVLAPGNGPGLTGAVRLGMPTPQ